MDVEGTGVQFLAWSAEFCVFFMVSSLRHYGSSKCWFTIHQLTRCNIPRRIRSSSESSFNGKIRRFGAHKKWSFMNVLKCQQGERERERERESLCVRVHAHICELHTTNLVHTGDAYQIQSLTLRRLMSYIYGAPILDVSRSHTMTQRSR